MKRCIWLALCLFALAAATPALAAGTPGPDDWMGDWCDGQHCLTIANVRSGPMGLYCQFVFTANGAPAGDGMAALEGNEGSYGALRFHLQKGGMSIRVTLDSGKAFEAEDAWVKDCAGVYVRKP